LLLNISPALGYASARFLEFGFFHSATILARMDPLHATLEEFAADGYTHVEANCPRCRVIRLRPIDQLPKISMGLTLDGLARYAALNAEGRCFLSSRGDRPMRAAGLGGGGASDRVLLACGSLQPA
jgi:hypothetical protein